MKFFLNIYNNFNSRPSVLYSLKKPVNTIYLTKIEEYWLWESKYLYKTDLYFYYLSKVEPRVKFKRNELRSTAMNKYLPEPTQFMNILKRHGLEVKYWLLMLEMSLLHRKFFEKMNIYFNTMYKNYLSFYFYAGSNSHFFDLDYILKYVTFILNPCIQLKVVRFPKFLQKKLRKKYDFKIKHVPVNLRHRYVYKRVIIYSGFVNFRKVLDRTYISLIETFLNPENNPLHKERLNFYKHTLKLYRFGKLNLHAL